ncbi:MAG: GNAT family N-acetyltransferase [Pseudomonadota bacterium]
MTWPVRPAIRAELPALARVWHDAWMETHAAHVPPELPPLRSVESMETRLANHFVNVRTLGPEGAPLGVCVTKDDEMHQLFITPDARGSGAAQALLGDAEARILAAGHALAWLDVLIENPRAIWFYEKCGWRRRGIEITPLETLGEPFPLKTLVMEKQLTP